jgi:hypothetical protein
MSGVRRSQVIGARLWLLFGRLAAAKHGKPLPTSHAPTLSPCTLPCCSPDPRTCRFTHSRVVRSCPADPARSRVFGQCGETKAPATQEIPSAAPRALRPAYPTSFSPPTPGPAPSPSPIPGPLPIPITAPQLVHTPHHKAPIQEKNRGLRPPPPPHLPPLPTTRRRLHVSTKPIPDPLPIPNAAPQFPKTSRPSAAPRLRTCPHSLLAASTPAPRLSPVRCPSRSRHAQETIVARLLRNCTPTPTSYSLLAAYPRTSTKPISLPDSLPRPLAAPQ